MNRMINYSFCKIYTRLAIYLTLLAVLASSSQTFAQDGGPLSATGNTTTASLSTMLNPTEKSALLQTETSEKNTTTSGLNRCSTTPINGLEVHVLGEVQKPGTFWVLPGTRLEQAISCAGGLNLVGSLRQINLRRGGGSAGAPIDLFSYRYRGALEQNPYLSNQDVVFVPPYLTRIRIIGAVKRPEIYEVLPSEGSIKKALQLAGGLTLLSDPAQPVTVLHPKIPSEAHAKLDFDTRSFTLADIDRGAGDLANGDILIANDIKNRDIPFDYSTLTIPGENTSLPTGFDKVFVTGDVDSPGPFPFHNFYSRTDYAYEAGITKTSSIKRLRVVAHGGVFRKKDEPLAPGDIIYIPSKSLTLPNALQIWNVVTSTFFTGFSVYTIIDNNNN